MIWTPNSPPILSPCRFEYKYFFLLHENWKVRLNQIGRRALDSVPSHKTRATRRTFVYERVRAKEIIKILCGKACWNVSMLVFSTDQRNGDQSKDRPNRKWIPTVFSLKTLFDRNAKISNCVMNFNFQALRNFVKNEEKIEFFLFLKISCRKMCATGKSQLHYGEYI